jgi:hypothetical protein
MYRVSRRCVLPTTQDADGSWRYVGGEVFNESFPADARYLEVCQRLNDKFGDVVSFMYLTPGDALDPENLVKVQGDDDLQVRLCGACGPSP